MNGGPAQIQRSVKALGKLSKSTKPMTTKLSTGVTLISKPSELQVPPWQLVSALLGSVPLRVASWWMTPEIYSTTATSKVGCWDKSLPKPGAVEVATTGTWGRKSIGLTGGLGTRFNHATQSIDSQAHTFGHLWRHEPTRSAVSSLRLQGPEVFEQSERTRRLVLCGERSKALGKHERSARRKNGTQGVAEEGRSCVLNFRDTRPILIELIAQLAERSVKHPSEVADMALTNGNIVTVDGMHPKAEAVAIKDGLILAVGNSDDNAGHIARVHQLSERVSRRLFLQGSRTLLLVWGQAGGDFLRATPEPAPRRRPPRPKGFFHSQDASALFPAPPRAPR